MYVTNDPAFDPFINTYIILEIDGVKAKYYVDNFPDLDIDIPGSAYALSNYNIVGLSNTQTCTYQPYGSVTVMSEDMSIVDDPDNSQDILDNLFA